MRICFILLFLSVCYCLNSQSNPNSYVYKEEFMEIIITSPAFEKGKLIPQKYSCDGKDISPPLKWSSIPEETKSLVLICDDPDAPMGTWVHWVVYDIPKERRAFTEDISEQALEKMGAKQGLNDFKKTNYGGPCPPGGTHRYFFKIYALDTVLNEKPGLTKKEILQRIEKHIIAQGHLMGKYQKK